MPRSTARNYCAIEFGPMSVVETTCSHTDGACSPKGMSRNSSTDRSHQRSVFSAPIGEKSIHWLFGPRRPLTPFV